MTERLPGADYPPDYDRDRYREPPTHVEVVEVGGTEVMVAMYGRAEDRLRETAADVVASNLLSKREAWALNASLDAALTAAEGRELLDFLGYPDPMPRGRERTTAVVLRILDARARGVHIS